MGLFKIILIFLLQFAVVSASASRLEEIRFILGANSVELNDPNATFEHILQLEKTAGRALSSQEIIWAAMGFVGTQKPVTESTDPKDPNGPNGPKNKKKPRKSKEPEDPWKRRCFTCGLRVLTPAGQVRLDELKIGDLVYSWDEARKILVENSVLEIHSAPDIEFGEINPGHGRALIQVTPEHPFYLPSLHIYEEIGAIAHFEHLLAVNKFLNTCESELVTRGPMRMTGRAEVRTISVAKAPHNFIVEGFVVHNKPIF
ncbi:MAG: Hint domain-containing protein [Bdellovibrionales bacterium]